MRIEEILIYPIELTFITDFSHSMKEGRSVKNVIVEVLADKGDLTGFGEGAPRRYVTGEDQVTALASLKTITGRKDFPWNIEDHTQLWSFIKNLPDDKGSNSALCALEIALLDALAKKGNIGIRQFLPPDHSTELIHYGVILPIATVDKLEHFCKQINLFKIDKVRVKVGPDLEWNIKSLDCIRQALGDGCEIRIDVNGCWDKALAIKHLSFINSFHVTVVEQPLPPGDKAYPDVAKAFKEAGAELMADESACSMGEIIEIEKERSFSMINVRLSKCGGFGRCIAMLDYLRKAAIRFQIGCHLGESGILSAAGRALALSCADASYFDGSYDSYLLSENLTTRDVTFDLGGAAGEIPGPGLGVEVDRAKLRKMSLRKAVSIKRPG
ncbi:MAG: hypothetical protein COZ70_02440 [Deltaproteobacteria bacterium CG_4_8_14_3_um_filter_51_11]|nr:hypothetical protein [bacterium]OIP42080.1 MAG: hypothetical protein AUK25_04540 [Desulfobacteraceae bacterium CG2_30_51_40]PIP45525.1 MAG: hypothetical protein COX16_12735 [Deltaproteobacteria bacterium CG23_combo_of_CG06-09_8_20_14_all_51_20]PIV99315.1 MAG: hypothetical protein COW41_08255 [Deltaproteobacteria bacterium CG17_big_fil_post_rev_8_21_14_2_50_51_6]PIX20652.1 MAG: hypothetical protein COZ70_02440 [Deltaproteobacteria bacterium CG_4_8_14_3_um_filter_51_11]PIY26659.1 MAG: hypothe